MAITITASLVKELRDKTGVGMMECKGALKETEGDIPAAIQLLRERGLSKAKKKADRETSEGRVIVHVDADAAVILELNCETDFVANNDNFIQLGQTIAKHILDGGLASGDDVTTLSINGSTLDETLSDAILQLGENIHVGSFNVLRSDAYYASYAHNNGKIGVIVSLTGAIDTDLGRDIAMQVAAMRPLSVRSEDVSSEDIQSEMDILRKQAISEGKPEAVVEKIVQGRISKFYKENCLLDQAFVKDPSKTIQSLLPGDVTVSAFVRLSLVD